MLAVLMVATIVGTTLLVLQQLRGQAASKISAMAQATATINGLPTAATTAAPDTALPTANGWTLAADAQYGDIQFSASAPQRGYLCGTKGDFKTHVFGTTTDGGQTWHVVNSPASYLTCTLQVSPSNPLDLTLTSINEPGDGQSAYVESHYSADGGQTWKAAPIPPNTPMWGTLTNGVLVWSGPYLYLVRQNTLAVSTNGGPFTPVSLSGILAGPTQFLLVSGIATADTFYLNVSTNACQQPCMDLIATTNGGATWAKVPNQSNVMLTQVQGTNLYGVIVDRQGHVSMESSTNGGTTWQPITLPATIATVSVNTFIAAPDQTIVFSYGSGVAYTRNGNWTIQTFSTSEFDSITVTAVSLDANGHPLKIWGHDDSKHMGVYWLPATANTQG